MPLGNSQSQNKEDGGEEGSIKHKLCSPDSNSL